MWRIWAILPATLLVLAGCAGKSKPQPVPAAMALPAAPLPAVMFTGDVRIQALPWAEGMTLAQALAGAQYTGFSDPRAITVTRNGVPYRVDVRKLLRGEENPELQPGDLVDVRR